jgi:hypothetical protein
MVDLVAGGAGCIGCQGPPSLYSAQDVPRDSHDQRDQQDDHQLAQEGGVEGRDNGAVVFIEPCTHARHDGLSPWAHRQRLANMKNRTVARPPARSSLTELTSTRIRPGKRPCTSAGRWPS